MASRSGELIILGALAIMAVGKVLYGTFLTEVSSSVYVLVTYGFMLVSFLPLFGRHTRTASPGPLLVLNIGTALCFLLLFLALKSIEPAAASAIQGGAAPILSLLIVFLWRGDRPGQGKLPVSLGLLTGCIVLSLGTLSGAGLVNYTSGAVLGLIALFFSALGSALITLSSKELSRRGWPARSIMAHRAYLIVPLAMILAIADGRFPALSEVPAILGIGMLTSILPMLLLQVGIERCEPHKVLVLMTTLPLFTYLIEGFSPNYVWTLSTALGILLILAAVLADAWMSERVRRG